MIEVIANADDFGKSHEVNLGILDGFKRGMLQCTTLMVNMPFADEAVQIAQENGFFDKVGPASEPDRRSKPDRRHPTHFPTLS